MSDEKSKLVEVSKAVGTVALAAADPTGGLVAAAASHALTNWTIESKRRKDNLSFWIEVIFENDEDRRRQNEDIQDELTQHRVTISWLVDELALALGRIENLEAVALGLLNQSDHILRLHPDPEMRPYLTAAFRNTVKSRHRFTPTWTNKLISLLEKTGADHLRVLLYLQRDSVKASDGSHVSYRDALSLTPLESELLSDLEKLSILLMDKIGRIHLTPTGALLAAFVSSQDPPR